MKKIIKVTITPATLPEGQRVKYLADYDDGSQSVTYLTVFATKQFLNKALYEELFKYGGSVNF